MKTQDIKKIHYRCFPYIRKPKNNKSIQPIGLDTEAYTNGKCFLLATSYGDSFRIEDFPRCLFSRIYRGQSFVCYNLKYDSGAFLQHLPFDNLEELRKSDSTLHEGYVYKVIGNKCLTVKRGTHSIHMYDMLNFYNTSLEVASRFYINMQKIDVDPQAFTYKYVSENWNQIVEYCIQDAKLVSQLAAFLIAKFESYGVYPKKLYSIAYVSEQYFRAKCPAVTVKRYWDKHKEVLSFAMQAYNGGKFEVTRKGTGYFYEYDIVSAYPNEIRNLIDISWARIVREPVYRKNAIYGFLKCRIHIPENVSSPVAIKRNGVNCYAVGTINKVITKSEYEYLISTGCDIDILDAYYLCCYNKQYPYKKAIDHLVKLKAEYKDKKLDLDYHTVKIIMNSYYGKFIQLIEREDYYEAGSTWNPVYGAVITANVRIYMSRLQGLFPCIRAVHTDSVLSMDNLDHITSNTLGSMVRKAEGQGVILGAGIYQVGEKVKFRGMHGQVNLMKILSGCRKTLTINYQHAYTWREIAHRGWQTEKINLFDDIPKHIAVNFDQKRLWLDDWESWQEVLKRPVESLPLIYPSPAF